MRLHLVRHGQTFSNVDLLLDTAVPGASLTDLGRAQAESLVGRLAGTPLEAIYVSDLVRTHETAAPLAAARGLVPVVLPGLREIHAGEDEMSSDWTRYVAVLKSWGTGDPGAMLPGGESSSGFLERFAASVGRIAAAGHETALLVSHGAAIRTWVGSVVVDFHTRLGAVGLPNTAVVTLDGEPQAGWELVGVDFPELEH